MSPPTTPEKTMAPEARLPEGMRRIGYDADSQTYTFKDHDGSLWMGSPGAEYGVLKRAHTAIDDARFWRRDSATSATSAGSDGDSGRAEQQRSFSRAGRRFTDFDGLPAEYLGRGGEKKKRNNAAGAVGSKFTQLKRTLTRRKERNTKGEEKKDGDKGGDGTKTKDNTRSMGSRRGTI